MLVGDVSFLVNSLNAPRTLIIRLDEAHYIKNPQTKCSKAVIELDSRYRWCLTGTPIVNGVADAFAYFRFIRIKPYDDHLTFKRSFPSGDSKSAAIAVERLQPILSSCLLRRTKHTVIDGKPILTLPNKHVEYVELDFSARERTIYNYIREKIRSWALKVEQHSERGIRGRLADAFVLIMRLRQACVDLRLIEDVVSEDDVQEALNVVKEAIESRTKTGVSDQSQEVTVDNLVESLGELNLTQSECRFCGDAA